MVLCYIWMIELVIYYFFFFQAEDGIRDLVRSRGLGDVYKRQLYYGDATNPNVLRHVKIEDARVLVVAISDPFMARRTVQVARGLNPKLHIVVRTRYLRELEELHQLGADDVVPEEFETSIEIFALVLRTYNICLLYTSDAADERSSVDLGGRRTIKKKKQ